LGVWRLERFAEVAVDAPEVFRDVALGREVGGVGEAVFDGGGNRDAEPVVVVVVGPAAHVAAVGEEAENKFGVVEGFVLGAGGFEENVGFFLGEHFVWVGKPVVAKLALFDPDAFGEVHDLVPVVLSHALT
jgi:hypothetical protein